MAKKLPTVLVMTDETDPEERERLLAAFREAKLDAELVASAEDDLAIARALKPRAIVFATHDHADRNRELVAELPGRVRILVGLEAGDIARAHAHLAYTGAESWVPLAEPQLAASLVAGWVAGKPPAAQLAALAARVPPPAKPTAREKARERAGEAYSAKLAAIDAQPLAKLARADAVFSARRRLEDAVGNIDRVKRAAALPPPLPDLWNLVRLADAVADKRAFARLFESDELAAYRATLAATPKDQLALFDEACAAKSQTARAAVHRRWRAAKPALDAFVVEHAAALDRAFARAKR